MKVEYTRQQGKRLTYTIEADRHGSYRILLAGKVLKDAPAQQDYFGKTRWGSKRLEADAVCAAQAAIELLLGMDEE